ncbi:MAG TPA: glycosyltransferase family 4 protein [Rhizomicrobium sp.]|nr:glycosyltransferase family 4 protein [Rhizomicrobium sp.]
MRILYHHRIRSKDGQAVHLEELIAALRREGHEVLLVGPEAFARASFGHDPKLLALVKKLAPNTIYELLELGYNLPAWLRLRRICAKFRPDFIYERYNLYLLAGVWYSKLWGVPLLLEVNAPVARERTSFGGLGLSRLAKWLECWVWRNADYVLPVTTVLGDEIRAAGTDGRRIAVIPNAIDPEKFPYLAETPAPKNEPHLSDKLVLGFTGFVRDWHGLDCVLRLLARPDVPANLHLLILGEGPAVPELLALARELGVSDRVTFAGLVERDTLAHRLAAFDIALLPRCVEYCSPLKLFEYMAAGKAIAAPDQANIREVLEGGVSGLLFPPDQPEAMAEAILSLARDGALRDRLGGAARALIASRGYTWEHNARRVSALGAAAMRAGRAHLSMSR